MSIARGEGEGGTPMNGSTPPYMGYLEIVVDVLFLV